jgi:hypothetical protein
MNDVVRAALKVPAAGEVRVPGGSFKKKERSRSAEPVVRFPPRNSLLFAKPSRRCETYFNVNVIFHDATVLERSGCGMFHGVGWASVGEE